MNLKQKSTELNADGTFKLGFFRKWIALILIGLGGGTIYIVPYLFNSYISQIGTVTGSTAQELSALITAYGVLSVIFYIPGGWIADKISARTLFSFSLVGTGVVSIWYSLLPFGFVDYAQLVIIHLLLAFTTVLTFWSAFVKSIKLLGPDSEQASLYSKTDLLRNIFALTFSFLTVAFFTVALPSFIDKGESQKVFSGIFLTILLYGIIYLIVGASSYFILPSQKKIKKAFSVKNNSHIFYDAKNDRAEILSKAQFDKLKKEYRIKFFVKQKNELIETLKQPAIYLIGLLILFTMNIFQTVGGVGQYFLIANGIDETLASTMQIVFFYAMPILGAAIFGFAAAKLIKNSIKTIGLGAIVLLILGIIMSILVGSTNDVSNLNIGWAVAALIIVTTLIIGGTRAIMWSTMSQAKIPLHLYGMAVGMISIIGFNNDIWLRLFLFSPLFANADQNITNAGYTKVFIWMTLNAAALIGMSLVIYFYIKKKNKVEAKNSKSAKNESIKANSSHFKVNKKVDMKHSKIMISNQIWLKSERILFRKYNYEKQ